MNPLSSPLKFRMSWPGSKRPPAALGLVVDGPSLHLAELGVSTPETKGSAAVTLPLDPDNGTALRESVASLSGRTRRCVVGLPAEWFMTVASAVPDLSEEDRLSFLTLEAEKGFPCDPAELWIRRSEVVVDGVRYVTQLGLRTEQVQKLEERLRAAGLRPASMTLTLAALEEPPLTGQLENGRLLVVQSAHSVSTLFTVDGELVQVRALDGSLTDPDALARELRITLEDLPPPLRSRLGSIRILGPLSEGRAMVEKLRRLPAFSALRIEVHEQEPAGQAGILVRRWLESAPRLPEFLPPRPSRWKQWMHRYNARRVGMVGAAAAAGLLLLAGTIAWQEYRSWSLRSEWAAMKPDVEVLNGVQDRIREFRPWHDTSFSTLSTLKLVTDVFPDTGSVTAKSIEIKGHSSVTITGSTRENAALLGALDRLRQRPEVTNLKIEQIRGKSPAQFTFSFQLVRVPSS
jgi:hypothetical protein